MSIGNNMTFFDPVWRMAELREKIDLDDGFQRFDNDRSGIVTKDEFVRTMAISEAVGVVDTDVDTVLNAFKTLDTNQDNGIDEAEYNEGVNKNVQLGADDGNNDAEALQQLADDLAPPSPLDDAPGDLSILFEPAASADAPADA
ncbi:MAG: hypothetical protein AB7P76_06685 [Candidatus Melainabacteria bacterium]